MIDIQNLRFQYPGSAFSLHIPRLQAQTGEKLAIIGPSGSGKSTLLKLIAGIVPPHSGAIRVDGVDVQLLSERARRDFRASRIGFVFQELELLDYLSVEDNILHTYRINPALKLDRAVRERARALAAETGLTGQLRRGPDELSQGERQRAALCRALLPGPALILADEATGNLDPANKQRILRLLFQAAERQGASLLAVTHDHELLPQFDRVLDFSPFQH
jgi:ABC-type lipoprotein export system ATPase subunit